jgi:Ser/Thr protein kinase RdoA (MazF antagonist)
MRAAPKRPVLTLDAADEPHVDPILELAGWLGLEPQAARILSRKRGKTVIHLWPEPVVARAVRLSDFGAGDLEQLHAQVAVARHLCETGPLVVPLAAVSDPGPHDVGGRFVTFWAFAEAAPVLGDTAREAGHALAEIHRALETFRGELRSAVDLVQTRLARASARLSGDERARLCRNAEVVLASLDDVGSPAQPLHGDAHLGNLARHDGALVWNDVEHACLGPVEWDLACLAVTSAALGRDRASTTAALRSYGAEFDPAAVDCLIDLRVLEFAALKVLDTEVDSAGLDFWLDVLEVRIAGRPPS